MKRVLELPPLKVITIYRFDGHSQLVPYLRPAIKSVLKMTANTESIIGLHIQNDKMSFSIHSILDFKSYLALRDLLIIKTHLVFHELLFIKSYLALLDL